MVDAQGAVIPAASVQATDQEKGVVSLATKTGADGLFVLQPLQPGLYSVEVHANGMKELQKKDVHLDPYQKFDLGQLAMVVGACR